MGASWQNASSGGLPNAPVMDLMIDWAAGRIVATTHGRGAFTAPLANLATPADVAMGKVPAAYFAPTQLGLDYGLTVRNLSSATAPKVLVSDLVPADATVVGVKTTAGNVRIRSVMLARTPTPTTSAQPAPAFRLAARGSNSPPECLEERGRLYRDPQAVGPMPSTPRVLILSACSSATTWSYPSRSKRWKRRSCGGHRIGSPV